MKRYPALTVFTVLFLATARTAFAHPGHDGDHDLVWDFGHLAAHPLATLGCGLVLVAAAWIGWRMLRTPGKSQVETAKITRRDR